MAAHAKFLFDTEFDTPGRGGESGRRAAEAAAAREAGFREGLAEGRRQAETESRERIERQLAELVRQGSAIVEALDAERERLAAEAAALAFSAARRLAPALIAREPHGELMALFEECIAHLSRAPHLVVRVPDGDPAELRERLADMARKAGFEGRIVVLREDGMAQGDCRIEWADGGIERDVRALAARIGEAIGRRYGAAAVEAAGEAGGAGATQTPDTAATADGDAR